MSGDEIDTMVGSLDMSNGHDRRLLRRAVRERWGVTDERKQALLEKLDVALQHGDVRDIVSVGKLLVQMEGQNQADEHLDDKNARLDEGKATERAEHYVVEMPKPRERLE